MTKKNENTRKWSPFVEKLVDEKGNKSDMNFLTGFPGPSQKEGCFRLYLSPDLASYYELPDDAVLHEEKSKNADSLESLMVWIKGDAPIRLVTPQNSKGAWLNGPLTKDCVPPPKTHCPPQTLGCSHPPDVLGFFPPKQPAD